MSGAAPLVSVVLPTYNRAHALRRSVGSVLAQSFRDLELIVVDDGGSDDTAGVVASFGDSRVRYVRRERNGGVAAARNTGVRAARGRYLAFQDSDDEWLTEKLERQVADLQPLDGRSMGICGVLRTATGSLLTYPRNAGQWRNGLDRRSVLTEGIAYTQSWLVPREALVEVGAFDERLCIWDDWELLIRLSGRVGLRTSEEPLVVSVRGADSLSADPQRFLRDLPLIAQKHAAEIEQHADNRAAIAHLHAVALYRARRYAEAIGAVVRALRNAPLHAPAWRMLLRVLLRIPPA